MRISDRLLVLKMWVGTIIRKIFRGREVPFFVAIKKVCGDRKRIVVSCSMIFGAIVFRLLYSNL
jgi:hypothetical protein